MPFALGVQLLLSFTAPLSPVAGGTARLPRLPPLTGVTPHADSLTATGVLCNPLPVRLGFPASCTAGSMDVRRPRLAITDPASGTVCIRAAEALLRGGVRFHAGVLSGRLLGVLPVAVPTSALPPLPLPYLTLDDVEAHEVQLTAVDVSLEHLDMTARGPCT
ncbi:hypothetical protein [Streptomyces hundungensis]|uniref:hypothetical protein n=1 Tax=Streptomyces hundungensis TaxID=1077946 RepID=UPI0033F5D591